MVDRVGQQLGNYQLIQLLGQGSLAEVYLGGHIHLGMLAAIKVLHAPLSSEEITPFRREARVIAHLVHPNIVRVLEFGIEDHTPFLVMDFAPHGSLRQHYPRGTLLPLASVVSYSRQVADACSLHMTSGWSTGMSSQRTCCWGGARRCCSVTLGSPSSRTGRTIRAPIIRRVP